MSELFLELLNRSISASYLVAMLVALRFVWKKAPKWVLVLLWGFVAVRLVCPVTWESAMSMIPSAQVVSPEIMTDWSPTIDTGIQAVNGAVNPVLTESFQPQAAASTNPLQIFIPVAAGIWLLGVLAMAGYTLFSYLRLTRQLRNSICLHQNIYQSTRAATPFILGFLKPRIYLPEDLDPADVPHVLAHEQTHIRRKDHWWKPIGFALLALTWFNPVMWLAYILFCRDLELACDESTVRLMEPAQRADYSQALLNCSIPARHISACPLAFGEIGVKARVKNILTYKRPTAILLAVCFIVCIVLAVCFLTDPKGDANLKLLHELDTSKIMSIHCTRVRNGIYETTVTGTGIWGEDEGAFIAEYLKNFNGEPISRPIIDEHESVLYVLFVNDKDDLDDISIYNIRIVDGKYLYINKDWYLADPDSIAVVPVGLSPPTDAVDEELMNFLQIFQGQNPDDVLAIQTTAYVSGEGQLVQRISGTKAQRLAQQIFKVGGVPCGYPEIVTSASYVIVMEDGTTFTLEVAGDSYFKLDMHWYRGYVSHLDFEPVEDITASAATAPAPDKNAYTTENARASVSFAKPGIVTGYTFFPEEATKLAALLNELNPAYYLNPDSVWFDPQGSVTLTTAEGETYLKYCDEWVLITYDGYSYCVQDPALLQFLQEIHANGDGSYETADHQPLYALRENYNQEEASIDGVVVQQNGVILDNQENWDAFITAVEAGQPSSIRCGQYYEEDTVIFDLSYDGNHFLLQTREKGKFYTKNFHHLVRYVTDAPEPYDELECWVLTDEVHNGKPVFSSINFESTAPRSEKPQFIPYLRYIVHPDTLPMPQTVNSITIHYASENIASIQDREAIDGVLELLNQGSALGYEPKTSNPGASLILIDEGGTPWAYRLDIYSALIQSADGTYYTYGPEDDFADYRLKLWKLLGFDTPPDNETPYGESELCGLPTAPLTKDQAKDLLEGLSLTQRTAAPDLTYGIYLPDDFPGEKLQIKANVFRQGDNKPMSFLQEYDIQPGDWITFPLVEGFSKLEVYLTIVENNEAIASRILTAETAS